MKVLVMSFSTRIVICLGLLLGIVKSMAAQEPEIKKESPFEFGASYIGEGVANLSGGIKTGAAYLGMANITVGFDTEKAKLWKGGAFYTNLANTHGDSPSEGLIGDFQVASNIEAGNHTYIQELWYAQQLGNVKVTLGLQDLNVELANSEHGALYRNSSFGIHSTISDNVPAPIFPLTTPGITLAWDITPKWGWSAAVYDGSPVEFEHNPYNLSWNFGGHDGVLAITELKRQASIGHKLKGTYKLGAYYHNHKLTEEELAEGALKTNYGFYGVIDQMVWEKTEGRGVGVFAQLSFSPKKDNEHCCYIGGGVNCYGVCGRENDVVGLGVAHARFNHGKKPETTFELTYKACLGENIYLQPDFQYIIHPAGADLALSDASVAALRFGLNF